MKELVRIVAFLMLGGIALFSIPHARTQAQKDDHPSAPGGFLAVTNTNDSGPGSLRQAILDANGSAGLDIIGFAIQGTGVRTISPTSALPAVNDPVAIDGYSQAGASSNTLPGSSNAVILIELNGANAGVGADGLRFTFAGSGVQGLAINRFQGAGIRINVNSILVSGNFIGTGPSGTTSLPNLGGGVLVTGANNTIGGTTAAARNLISGNGSAPGVSISGGAATGNSVRGNLIGTNAAGTAALPNSDGIILTAPNNTVGGTAAGSRNVISGNTADAITIFGAGANANTIQGNYLGTDVTGAVAVTNGGSGVYIEDGANNIIGGTTAAARNVISGNGLPGVDLNGPGNLVQGNYIGTDASGLSAISNRRGVRAGGTNNLIGGTTAGAGNLVAFNTLGGVRVPGTGISILGNAVFDNGITADLGIDLEPLGVTPNDIGDPDTGANNLQNFPILNSTMPAGANTTIRGTLNSVASTSYRIELFANTVCDTSGNGEGRTFLGSVNVTTDGAGNAPIDTTVPAFQGGFVTATATRLNGQGNPTDTSEFSACFSAPAGVDAPLLFTTNRDGNTEIYKMHSDGTGQQRLTNTPQAESQALWSPNGQKIVYGKTIGTGNSQIWLMNADGSGQTLISDATAANSGPKWSPSGQKILFTRRETGGTDQVWTMNADGSNRLRLTNSATHDHFPDWSPDGARIAFGRCNLTFVCDIFTINADGSNPTNLTPTNPNDDDHPNWTPDGSKIVFGGQNTPDDYNAFVMNADGTSRQPLTTSVPPASFQTGGVFPVSPDGTRVALGSRDGSPGVTGIEIQTVSINGTNLTNVTNNAVLDLFSVWSPNGSKIGFGSRRDAATDEIYAMNADGSGVQRLTNNTFTDTLTDWFRAPSGLCSSVSIGVRESMPSSLNDGSCVIGADKTDLYTFTGTANQQVAISLETTQFFSKIELLNPAGAVIASAGGVSGVNNSRLPATGYFTLAVAGTYTIRAIAAFGGAGSYNISLFEAPVQNCTYSLSPTRTEVPSAGGTFFFDVVSQPGCPPASQPASSGVIYNNLRYNGGRVSFNVSTNEFPAARTDTITVAGQTHTINQFGLAAPANDAFGSAQVVTGLNSPPNAPVVGYNTTATAENGEPTHAGSPATRSVWYRYTPAANASGLYSFSTSGSSFDTVMAVYACPTSGACTFANMTPVGSNDDTTFFDITSKVNFRADGGTTYMIAVDGKNGASGTVNLSWRQYQRLFRLYLQTYNGTQSPLVPDTVTASNGSNTVIPLLVSLGVYEFNLPSDGTTYIVTITGPTGIVWDPNNFPLDTSFRYLDELMRGDGTAGGQNSVSNAQNQTPRFIFGYIRNITSQELTGLGVIIGSSRGPNPREETPCSPLGSQTISSVQYATYQCLSQPNTLHDIVPNMAGKIFTVSVLSFDVPINTTYNGTPGNSFIATNTPTYNITGTTIGAGAGTEVALTYTPTGNTQAITLRTMTPASGAFSFPNLAPNTYQLRATRTGAVFTQPAPVNLQSNQTIDISLESACSFTPGQSPSVPVAGGLSQIMVNTSQTTCEWLAASDVPWITINSGAIVGNGPVHFTAQANTGGGRIGSIRIQGRPDPILIQQATTNPTFGTLAGRVLTPDGRALRNAVVTLIDAANQRTTVTTSSFGVYNFANVQLGQIYTATVSSKRYRFAPRTLAFTANLSGVEFVGLE